MPLGSLWESAVFNLQGTQCSSRLPAHYDDGRGVLAIAFVQVHVGYDVQPIKNAPSSLRSRTTVGHPHRGHVRLSGGG